MKNKKNLTTRAVTKTKEERSGRGDGSSEEIWLSASFDIFRVIAIIAIIIMVIPITTIITIILTICVIIIFASVGQHHHYHRTLVSGRTIGKDITLVSRRAPPHTAKGKTKPLQNNLDDDTFLVDGVVFTDGDGGDYCSKVNSKGKEKAILKIISMTQSNT